ncbi:integrase arm-type DNA-binding domain-containing protein [Methylomonas sp. MgM2]
MAFDDYPGLRLSAMAKVRTWFYRYGSSVDGRLRQVSIGHWSSMSFPSAIVAWEALKNQRDSGGDPVLEAKQAKLEAKALTLKQEAANSENAYTVRVLCDEYLAGHVRRH